VQELLTSTEPSVLGAALFSFQEVCPERLDMLHSPFRRICHLLADFEEHAQVIACQVLTRYGRTQFLSPFKTDSDGSSSVDPQADPNRPFYSDEEEEEAAPGVADDVDFGDFDDDTNDRDGSKTTTTTVRKVRTVVESPKKKRASVTSSSISSPRTDGEESMNVDHKLLIKQTGMLVTSSNAAVVQAVVALYYHLAPRYELFKIARPLVRFCRSKAPTQYCILTTVATLSSQFPDMFRPFVKDFFVWSTDPRYIRELKIDVMCSVASESTISSILREFQSYVCDPDKAFVSKVVQAMGRTAQMMPSIAESCMQALMKLVSSPSESVVACAVISIRQLLQANTSLHTGVVRSMARLVETVKVKRDVGGGREKGGEREREREESVIGGRKRSYSFKPHHFF
jgi:AP-3 complex subunit beta